MADYMEGYFSSDLHLVLNYQPKNEYEFDQGIAIEGCFLSP